MKRCAVQVLVFLLLAAFAYEATILATPRLLMAYAMHRVTAGVGLNHILHAPRADENARAIVMPSPDLLYSACAYDLAAGPLRVHAPIPRETYWSLAAYDARTDNYFTIDDRTAEADAVDLVLVADDVPLPAAASGTRVVRAPGNKGLVLLRTLVDRDERASELDGARRQASCAALPAGGA
jgi:uncharacterized membrane protein